jgi:hypothetical protein
MWNDVVTIIERLAAAADLRAATVGEALSAVLTTTLDDPRARRSKGELRRGPFAAAELREVPPTGVVFLRLPAHPARPVVVPHEGLKKFGPPKWRSVEPKSGPEGTVTECFDVGDTELRVGYGTQTRMLETVALGRPPDPATARQ